MCPDGTGLVVSWLQANSPTSLFTLQGHSPHPTSPTIAHPSLERLKIQSSILKPQTRVLIHNPGLLPDLKYHHHLYRQANVPFFSLWHKCPCSLTLPTDPPQSSTALQCHLFPYLELIWWKSIIIAGTSILRQATPRRLIVQKQTITKEKRQTIEMDEILNPSAIWASLVNSINFGYD